LAGATGGESATGTAKQSSGPSAGYGGRVIAKIKPNIVFADDISGNPVATVEVRTSPDGTIIGRKLIKSSGVKAWDDAVLRAIDKTEILPRDLDGRVPPSFEINFRPKD
jgi:colicin import membrane protein